MPNFKDFNTENKLRIPLSAYAAQIVDNDCRSFSMRRTTLINVIILNYYQSANCTISLQLRAYKKELEDCIPADNSKKAIIEKLIKSRAAKLTKQYNRRANADVNWQITLNKHVKEFLTLDTYTCEEQYYGQRPGRYVRALIEEYSRLPYYQREEIVYKDMLEVIKAGIDQKYVLNLTTMKETHISLKPYKVETDPLSMFHYLIGMSIAEPELKDKETAQYPPQVMSIRISRLTFT